MKILDKYVAKSFLTGYVIAFCVLMGLRIIPDLFVNLDEFSEHSDIGTLAVMKNILTYYALNSTLYFRDASGMIIVIAAGFSLGKMVHANELVAILASGISLKRVIAPIVILSTILTGLMVIDQEFIIPPLAHKLVRSHDDLPGQEFYDIWFISDSKGSLICSQRFDVKTSTLHRPTIITRKKISDTLGSWETTTRIDAQSATFDPNTGKWILIDGWETKKDFTQGRTPIDSYTTEILPTDIPVRTRSKNKTLLSFRQLSELAQLGTKIKDLAQVYSQKHFRITDPIMNLVMLMISLPILVCRDPKAMKGAIGRSFAILMVAFILTFTCKMLATEVIFDTIMPEFWAWLPVFIFVPVAVMELDSMKT
ncbi:MAG: YjgP/YjgQ family permease [Planctomycetes bacterium]|nr:YjgP/YjgQ family permease [Planctomycetota bacterium]